jgi:putative copper export protein
VSADGVSVALRALGFIALFQAVGATLFAAGFARLLTVTAPALRRFGMHMAWLAALLVAAQFALEPARMAGEWAGLRDTSLRALALHSRLAMACACKLAGLVIVLLGLTARHGHGARVALAGALITLGGFLLVGHTAAHPQRGWLAPLLLLHLLVLAFWFGSLWPLWQISRDEPTAVAADIVTRFSARAVVLVPMMFLAGVAMAALLLPDAAALQSRYGRLLLTKTSAFALLMGLAAMNKWRLGPALRQGHVAAGRRFRMALLLEAALLAATVGVTAALTLLYSPET